MEQSESRHALIGTSPPFVRLMTLVDQIAARRKRPARRRERYKKGTPRADDSRAITATRAPVRDNALRREPNDD